MFTVFIHVAVNIFLCLTKRAPTGSIPFAQFVSLFSYNFVIIDKRRSNKPVLRM